MKKTKKEEKKKLCTVVLRAHAAECVRLTGLRGTPAGMTTTSASLSAAASDSWCPVILAGLSQWDRSAVTPWITGEISYTDSSVIRGCCFRRRDRGWPIPPGEGEYTATQQQQTGDERGSGGMRAGEAPRPL